MVQQIHILVPYLLEIILALDRHGRNFYPVSVFPVAAGCGNLAQIDLGVEVGGKCVTMVTAVAIQNIDLIDLVKLML